MLTGKEIDSLATLSHIDIAQQEKVRLQKNLEDILAYMKVLEEANTKGLEPVSQITGLENNFRNDTQEVLLSTPAELVEASPAKQDQWIKVAKIIEKG